MTHRSTFASASAALLLAACASAPPAYPDGTLEGLFEAERAFACLSVEKGSMQDSSDFKISYCPRFGFRTLVKSWRMRLSAMT